MKKFIKFLTSKTFIIGIFLLFQLFFLFFLVYKLSNDSLVGIYVHILFAILAGLIVLNIISSNENPTYKLAWIVPVLAFPIFGAFFYIFYHQSNLNKPTIKKHQMITSKRSNHLLNHNIFINEKETNYLNKTGWRYYENTQTKFFPSGEAKFEQLIIDLKTAEKFIFMEYFIMSNGYLFNEIINILIEKANQGVEVKIIYDDFGSADRLPYRFRQKMAKHNIEVINFNPMRIHLNFVMNYRDHRKIVVIDNKIGYTGGINIGDEYINKVERFGHWNDAAIKLEGEAVWSLTLTFIENWNFSVKKDKKLTFKNYYIPYKVKTDGIVAPFADNPVDNIHITRNLFLYLINSAKKDILITTPYLIFDNELNTALKLAVKSGIKVKIIIPKIPDKKLVYSVTEAYALELVEAGVEVYKYSPGFIHSKTLIVDSKKAIIGTTNLDYRSLYLHFENNVYLYNNSAINDMLNYFNNTLAKSELQTVDSLKRKNFIRKIIQAILTGFAPIL